MVASAVEMSMFDISRFDFENWHRELTSSELKDMTDQQLFDLQSRMSISYMQQIKTQRGFGTLTMDAYPDHEGNAHLHLVPYKDMSQDRQYGYIAKNPLDHATLYLMATADMQSMLDYYSASACKPKTLVAITHHKLGQAIQEMGFEVVPRYYLEDPDPTTCKLTASLGSLFNARKLLEAKHIKAQEQLSKYGITLRSARIDAIIRNSNRDYK